MNTHMNERMHTQSTHAHPHICVNMHACLQEDIQYVESGESETVLFMNGGAEMVVHVVEFVVLR